MVVKRTLFSTPIASFLFGASFNTYLLRAYQSMKFETRSGCKLLSISLSATKENIWDSLSLSPQQKLWCRDQRGDQDQARRHVWSRAIRKLIGPAKTRLQRYVEEASSLPSYTVEKKIVMEDELRVEEVISCRELLAY